MRDVVDQLYREADRIIVHRGPGFHADQVHVSRAVFAAFDQWVAEESVFVGRPAAGAIRYGRFEFRSMDSLEGGTALLSGPKGVLAAVELKLDPRCVVTAPRGTLQPAGQWAPFRSSKDDAATYAVMDLAAGPDQGAIIHYAPVSKKIVIDPKASRPAAVYGASPVSQDAIKDAMAAFNKKLWQDLMFNMPVPPSYMKFWHTIPGEDEEPALLEPLPVRQQAEGIVAYRTWSLLECEAGDWRLKSITAKQVWDGPILRADAAPADQQPPVDGGQTGHGIYAWKERSRATSSASPILGNTVAGEVELRGRVVVHQHGYRAERARILRLQLAPPRKPFVYDPALIESLEERYHCDVHIGGW